MLQFSVFYSLGTTLGMVYYHIPFRCLRSTSSKFPYLLKKWAFTLIPHRLHKWFPELCFDIYEKLGLNEYLTHHFNQGRSIRNLRTLAISLGDQKLTAHSIRDLVALTEYLNRIFESAKTEDEKQIHVIFSLSGKRGFFDWINNQVSATSTSSPLVSWRKSSELIGQHKCISGQDRILAHLRQGDTAVFPTEWGTFIPVWHLDPSRLKQHDSIQTVQFKRVFNVTVIESIFQTLGELTYLRRPKFFLFSDGFALTVKIIRKHWLSCGLSFRQLFRFLLNWREQERSAFALSEKVQVSVGDSGHKLLEMILSSFTSDIIITTSQQRMLLKLFSVFYDPYDMPPVIVIGKETSRHDAFKNLEIREIMTESRVSRLFYICENDLSSELWVDKLTYFLKRILNR